MASHHHLCHPSTASYCRCYSTSYSACHHHPPDSHFLFHPPPQPNLCSAQTHLPNSQHYYPHFRESSFQEERQTHPTIVSLLRRIAVLESALHSRSSSLQSVRDAAARTIQSYFRAFLLRRSRTLRQLKDLASIKSTLRSLKSSVSERTHFDYDVIYRKAMNLLLKLDAIQGGDPMIRDGRSSIRRELNKFLDSIDGFCLERRVLSSGVNVRYDRNNVKHSVANGERNMGNVQCGDLRSVDVEKLRGLVERIDRLAEELDEVESEVIESPSVLAKQHGVSGNKCGGLVRQHSGVQPKVKKSVSFADNGKVYRVFRRNSEPFLVESYDDSIDGDSAGRDLKNDFDGEVEEFGVQLKEAEDDDEVEAHTESGGSLHSSDGEKDSRIYLRSEGNSGSKMYNQGEADDFTFSAPLPLKMESRTDLIDKRKKLANNI
ncbi:BAG family molecular chaperone regulator 8, chloroplastic [Sesamum indicum]|uniref:BAG family molecular chaperone regulator 8, chloroplastic n=1 Tax=Sesamum indicum TaxID=4182 RepID=A0A6I9UUT9_SESIN|nr:BAG family molecular chaperone regulator 8, chloroplastic [Sesamum indicum]